MMVLVALLAWDIVQFWHLLVIGLVTGSAASFDWPARMVRLTVLVDRPLLPSAVAINATTFNASHVLGALLGGWLIGLVGVAWCFGLCAAAVVPFIAMFVVMPMNRRHVITPSGKSSWQDLREGYVYMWQHKPIRAALSVDIVPIKLGMSYITMGPAIARDVLHMGSEEEVVTPLVMSRVTTYRDLPQLVYQIGWEFRDEVRSKFGVMWGREFLMKDMYSFYEDQADFDRFYAIAKQAYLRAYERLGLTARVTEASGGTFSEKISYEFMVLTDAGDDDILYCDACDYCINLEISQVASRVCLPRRAHPK